MDPTGQSHVRLRFGDNEVEWTWTGPVPKDIEERLTRLLNRFMAQVEQAPSAPAAPHAKVRTADAESKKPRGGARRASVSKGIDDIIDTQWLIDKRAEDIAEKLRESYPGATAHNVTPALIRRLNKTITRRKENGEWLWSVITKK